METVLSERTPLLKEPTIPRRNHSFDEKEPSDGVVDISNKQAPLDGFDAVSREQTPTIGEGSSSNSDKREPLVCSPRTFERKRNVYSLEEAVQALYSAWQRNRQPKRDITLEYFTTRETCAMHKAWKNVTSGRNCSSQPHKIAEALATTIAKELLSVPECVENDISIDFHMEFTKTKNLLKANLLEEWTNIDEGEWFPVRYIETVIEDSDEQPPSVSEFWLRQVELYDKVRDFFLNPKLQALLPILLFFWPLFILAIGTKYMECPMGHHLSYLLTILGCVGCVATVYRLVLLHITILDRYPYKYFLKWKILRLIEFTFLIVFIVQAFHFFDIDLIAEVGTNQCENFYKKTLMLNYVSIPLVSACVFAYSVLECVYRIDIWHWLFRHI